MDRINNIRNSVGHGIGTGVNNPSALHTDSDHVYRITGMDQIQDIIECGYVRPKENNIRQWWSIGGRKLHYVDKTRVILESNIESVKDGQIGAISIDDLTAIWIFDETENKYIDRLDYIKSLYEERINQKILK